jgi:hypothetical protein
MPTAPLKDGHAFAAAQSASEAAADLIRLGREGEGLNGPFDIEVIEKLADALVMAMEIEGDETAEDERGQLYSAAKRFLEGWA